MKRALVAALILAALAAGSAAHGKTDPTWNGMDADALARYERYMESVEHPVTVGWCSSSVFYAKGYEPPEPRPECNRRNLVRVDAIGAGTVLIHDGVYTYDELVALGVDPVKLGLVSSRTG